jgi:hypothetical protein
VRLFFAGTARRCIGIAGLLFFALPVGLSVIGCGNHSTPVQYCNAGDAGPIVGQVAKIVLAPNFATVGESLNYGQIGASLSASSYDCKGNTVSSSGYTYATTSSYNVNQPGGPIFADINPRTGQICGGTWNRNTGGGIPDYTTCTPPSSQPSTYLAYATATSNGAVSNPIAVYVHPVVTSIVLGTATGVSPGSSCPTATTPGVDPGTDCSLCSPPTSTGTPLTAPVYDAKSCLSQTQLGQLVARVYSGGKTDAAHNITCQVGHVSFAAQTPNIATIDQSTGVATANQPGSTIITATVANSSTATQAGFLSTCPPASIVLGIPGQPGANSVNVAINNTQPLTTTVVDTKGNQITGLALAFISTTPQTIPAGSGSVTPAYPGSADITATCLPSSCNPSPFSQIGLFGNGKPITSNPITVTAAGTSSTVIYMGSTQSQYVLAQDFTTNQPGTLIKLPYVPNSMVINLSGSGVYLGSAQGLMSFSTANNLLGAVNQSVPGYVLSLSPDGSTLVITDPTRATISLVTSSGGVVSTYGGIATEAKWSPDAQTVYITTTTGEVLTHNTFTDWQTAVPAPTEQYTDVAVTVPHLGAYFAGPSFTDGRSYCSASTVSTKAVPAGTPPQVSNVFIPVADESPAQMDRIAATTDGKHMIGAHLNADGTSTLSDLLLNLPTRPCPIPDLNAPGVPSTPVTFQSSLTTYPLTGITAAPITGVSTPLQFPLAITGVYTSSNSAAAFVSYTGSTNTLPFYAIPSTGAGKLQVLTLGNGASANSTPVSGVFSTDNLSFYAGTYGPSASSADNDVHIISLAYPTGGTPTAAETGIVSPNLPLYTGTGYAPVNLLVQRPKKSTN